MPPKVRGSGVRSAAGPKPSAKGAPADVEGWRSELFRSVERTAVVQRSNANGGEKYEGQVTEDGKRHGKGMLWWPNGNIYAGEWAAGAMCGNGSFHYAAEGDRYTGGFRDDKKHGAGRYTFANGNAYAGDFAADKRHGSGKYSWMCGDEYEGDWFEGRMHGRGVTAYANGNKYAGSFVEDRREGNGKLTCTDGLAYDGEWLNNNRHGTGRLDFPSGDFYVGEWRHDKKDGRGKDSFANGNEYTGEYRANAKHGTGRMSYNNGDIYEGGWAQDKMEGHGVYRFSNGFVYDGEWKEDMRHGYGQYTFPNGHVYVGEWMSDRRHGAGKLTLSSSATENSGEAYTGTWREGKMHGDFAVTDAGDRRLYAGTWKEGAPSGEGAFWLRSEGRSVVLQGSLAVSANAKKGMGTIDGLPAVVGAIAGSTLLEAAACRAEDSATAHVQTFPLRVVSDDGSARDAPPWSAERSVVGDVATEVSVLLSDQRERAVEAAISIHSQLTAGAQQLTAARKTVSLVGSLPDAIAKAMTATQKVEHLHQEQSAVEAELELTTRALTESKAIDARSTERRDDLKATRVDYRQRLQSTEQQERDAKASSDRLAQLQRSLQDAETSAASAETHASGLKQEQSAVEQVNAELDRQLRVAKDNLSSTEALVMAVQKRTKEGTADRKSSIKRLSERSRSLEETLADHQQRLAKAVAGTRDVESAIDSMSKKHDDRKAAGDRAIADADQDRAAAEEELDCVRGDTDDVRAESRSIAIECEKKEDANEALSKESERLKLQQQLYADEAKAADDRLQAARLRSSGTEKAFTELDMQQRADGALQELRTQLDRELLAVETDAKRLEAQVNSAEATNEDLRRQLADALDVPLAPSGSGVQRIRSIRTAPTPPTEDPEAVQELEEQLRAATKKLAKKREKLASLHREARDACGAWLPSDRDSSSSVLASAAKESQLNQVMKLRNQLDRLTKECSAAEADVARSTASNDDDTSEGHEDADERFLREIESSMRAADKDWRINYLLEQLKARQGQIADLQKDAEYAKRLEAQVQEANSAVSGFKQQPRSAGSKPPQHDGVPLRSTPGLGRRDGRLL